MKYKILLFDADNTILDFDKAEENALKKTFEENNLSFNREILSIYRFYNTKQWQLFEQGKIKKEEVVVQRFVETFQHLKIHKSSKDILPIYEQHLKEGYEVMENAVELLEKLKDKYQLYIITNGVAAIQNSRMKGSKMEKYFIRRFISEEIGYPKPSKEYFAYCFQHIPHFQKKETLIIGDSLSSDIQGGVNVGIDTCWFNPNKKENKTDIQPTYEIHNLLDLLKILDEKTSK